MLEDVSQCEENVKYHQLALQIKPTQTSITPYNTIG